MPDNAASVDRVSVVRRVLENADLWMRARLDDLPLTGDPAQEVAEDIVAALREAGAFDDR